MGDTLFHRFLFCSMSFLRMVTVSVVVLTPATTNHHFYLKWISDPTAEANPSHETVISQGDENGTGLRESQVRIPCLIRSSVVKVSSGEVAEAYLICKKTNLWMDSKLISGSHRARLMAFRCLKQIFTDLLWKRRPPWKPPWNQFIRILQFRLSISVKKNLEIMDLSWVICTTKIMPSPGVGVGDVCNVCGVVGMMSRLDRRLWIYHRRLLIYLTVMDSYLSVRKKFTISSEVGVLFFPMTTNSATTSIKHIWRGFWSHLWVIDKVIYLIVMSAYLFRKRIPIYGVIDALFLLALTLVGDAVRMRTRRPNLQHIWVEAIRRRIKRPDHQHEEARRRHNTSSGVSFMFQREAYVIAMSSISRQQLKVMLKAFWSLSYMLLAINIKYMKGGSISHSLIARKAYVQQAGLIHSIIEATASHICEKRLYHSLSLLFERLCISNLVYQNDVLVCY